MFQLCHITILHIALFCLTLFNFPYNIYSQNCTYTVTSTNDPVDPFNTIQGELRWAIQQANLNPGSIICFNISNTPYEINLKSSLTLSAPMIIDGSSQPGYSINQDPKIIIDANNQQIYIFQISPSGAGTEIKGLLLRNIGDVPSNFGDYPAAISVNGNNVKITNNMFHNIGTTSSGYFPIPIVIADGGSGTKIKGNILGTDINGTNNTYLNFAGIYLFGTGTSPKNCVIGGTGVGDGNTIAFGIYYAIGIQYCAYNTISRNPVFNSITLVVGTGNLGKPAPIITSAKVNTSGIVTVKGTASAYDVIEIFGSAVSGANQYLATVSANASGNWSTTISNVSWPYLVATATDQIGSNDPNLENTSELSSPVPITNCCSSAPPLNIFGFYVGSGNW